PEGPLSVVVGSQYLDRVEHHPGAVAPRAVLGGSDEDVPVEKRPTGWASSSGVGYDRVTGMKGPARLEAVAEIQEGLIVQAATVEGLVHPHPVQPTVTDDARIDGPDALEQHRRAGPARREVGSGPELNAPSLARLGDHESLFAVTQDVRI